MIMVAPNQENKTINRGFTAIYRSGHVDGLICSTYEMPEKSSCFNSTDEPHTFSSLPVLSSVAHLESSESSVLRAGSASLLNQWYVTVFLNSPQKHSLDTMMYDKDKTGTMPLSRSSGETNKTSSRKVNIMN